MNSKIYNFISYGRFACFLSIILCITSCSIIITHGFNWGLDFTGGLLIEVISEDSLDLNKLNNSFIQSGFKNVIVQYLSNVKNAMIRLSLLHNDSNLDQTVKTNILNILNNNISNKFVVQKMTWISPSVGGDLLKKGIMTLFIVLVCILVYVTLRFELKLAIGTIISLIHDIIIILGILSLFSIEISSTIIAALISAISYSLNDNIVIFDRIRENFNYMSDNKLCFAEVFNISLTQVLKRTIITSATTIMALLMLLVFGGSILYEFSIILLIGITIGTISSIYIASILAFYLKTK